MLRRHFLAIVGMAPKAAAADERVPTDIEELNAFAAAYNLYAEQLHRGVVDVKQWKKTVSAWRTLVRS